jgi:hypothetical protein
MNDVPSSRIVWREPFRTRARVAAERLRRRWRVPVGAGASLAVLGLTLLAIWAYSLNEPFNLRAAALVCAFGLLVLFLLTLDDFIPSTIKLREQAIQISHPAGPTSIRYPDLQGCDLTTGPAPQFRGFGRGGEPLFTALWDPSLDPELLRAFLALRGIPLSAAPSSSSFQPASPETSPE